LQITDKFKARSLIKEKEENRKQSLSTLFTKPRWREMRMVVILITLSVIAEMQIWPTLNWLLARYSYTNVVNKDKNKQTTITIEM